jgi:hypothetical protein
MHGFQQLVGLLFGILITFAASVKGEPVSDEDFEPTMEAPFPDGFPNYTAVGRIEVKSYPAYRMAKADSGFWTLFSHIKRNKVEMTAPVQLDYEANGSEAPRESAMAFLYGSPDMGTAGPSGRVTVIDVPADEVVSIGVRGVRSQGKVAAARESLLKWLDNNEMYTTAGDLRVMAYNSPFVPRDRQFFEVQIPVRKP